MIRRAAQYLSGGEAVLAYVVDERASRGYELSVRGLLGRRQRDAESVTSVSESAAENLLADAGALLEGLCPGLRCRSLVLRGVPGEELARVAHQQGVDAVFVGRGTPGSRVPVEISGTLAGWKRNHHGDVDGFFLDEGSEVHFPPHRATDVQRLVRERAPVEVRGEYRGRHIHAFLVTDPESRASVELHRPPAGEPEKHHLGGVARFVVDHVPCDVVVLS